MKVPKPSLILHSLINKGPLPQLTAEETERSLKCTEERGDASLSEDSSENVDLFQDPRDVGNQPQTNPQSPCFKAPVAIRSFLASSTTNSAKVLPRLVNLSFSQPNSPRTPCVPTCFLPRLATPVPAMVTNFTHRQSEESMLNSPCVTAALHELQMTQDTGLPDIVALIEDDMTGLSQVERQLMRNTEVELTDHNVVDYLLDVAHDPHTHTSWHSSPTAHHHHPHPMQPPPPRTTQSERSGPNADTDEENGLNVRRKRARRNQKRMTAEEARVVRRQRAARATRALRDKEGLGEKEGEEEGGTEAPQSPALPHTIPSLPSFSSSASRSPERRRSKRIRRQTSLFEVRW